MRHAAHNKLYMTKSSRVDGPLMGLKENVKSVLMGLKENVFRCVTD